MIPIKIKKIVEYAILPKRAYEYDAGFDLYSSEENILKPNERKLVKTGIAIEMPLNYHAEIRPRSGLAIKHGITVLNAPATIDSGYRGEIQVILINHSDEEFLVNKGERIAQLLFSKVDSIAFEEVEELSDTTRGEKGFGSSGV
ncbi:MAG: dUTP diphosphatase [Nanoarchaeota archaeon]|nr:dUTP diphosphatase [Nanoarchaeota archaeon]